MYARTLLCWMSFHISTVTCLWRIWHSKAIDLFIVHRQCSHILRYMNKQLRIIDNTIYYAHQDFYFLPWIMRWSGRNIRIIIGIWYNVFFFFSVFPPSHCKHPWKSKHSLFCAIRLELQETKKHESPKDRIIV